MHLKHRTLSLSLSLSQTLSSAFMAITGFLHNDIMVQWYTGIVALYLYKYTSGVVHYNNISKNTLLLRRPLYACT